MTTFQVGKTYSARSACDHDCVFTWEVVSRTAKRITLNYIVGGTVRDTVTRGVRVWDGVETAMPFGSYSMAPAIRADRHDD